MRIRGLIVVNVILAFVLTILASGCTQSGNSVDKSQPPQIPPRSTFIMDFGDFTQTNQTSYLDRSALMVSLFQDYTPVYTGSPALGDRSNSQRGASASCTAVEGCPALHVQRQVPGRPWRHSHLQDPPGKR